jgi:hypothetical protein
MCLVRVATRGCRSSSRWGGSGASRGQIQFPDRSRSLLTIVPWVLGIHCICTEERAGDRLEFGDFCSVRCLHVADEPIVGEVNAAAGLYVGSVSIIH